MNGYGRGWRVLLVLLAISLSSFRGFSRCEAQEGLPQPRCMRDAEGELYCAQWDMGVAVRNGEGDIVCAPGTCVRASDVNPDWSCSSEEGGRANVTPEVPVCDGGCQPPDENSCNLVDNIDDNQ